MKLKKIVYSAIALSKRRAIKKDIKDKYGQATADRTSKHISDMIAKLKKFPEIGISMREQYGNDSKLG